LRVRASRCPSLKTPSSTGFCFIHISIPYSDCGKRGCGINRIYISELGVDLVKLLHFIWSDIDRDFKTITFERTLVLSDDGLVIKQGLKTQQRRVYPCGEGLQVFLKSIAPEEIDRGRLVFTPPKAKYVDMHNFSSKKWKPILLVASVDYRKLSSIRHTCILFCIDGGMDAKDVAKLVGNSPEIIYRHYARAKRNLVAPGF
jgi:integrase